MKIDKSGCLIENRQLGSANRLEACLAIDLVVAWRLLDLTKLGRENTGKGQCKAGWAMPCPLTKFLLESP